MNYNKINLIYFSATHTSEKIAKAIAKGTGISNQEVINITLPINENVTLNDELTIIAMPVYSGRIPEIALKRFQQIKANNSPAILAVVYGNRDYDDALIELRDESLKLGFQPIAGGAFIGEHSYSTEEYPVAANRPDLDDLEQAENFGKDIIAKLRLGSNTQKQSLLHVKGNFPYLKIEETEPSTPSTIEDLCTQCGHCVDICPIEAIHLDDKITSQAEKCIQCCACVKECPVQARSFITPFSEILYVNFSARKNIELFYSLPQ